MIDDGLDGLDDIPGNLPDADRQQLIGDLDSLRGLLDDRRLPAGRPGAAIPPADPASIPILLEAVAEPRSVTEPVALEPATAPPQPAAPRSGAAASAAHGRRHARAARDEFQQSLFGEDLAPPPAVSPAATPASRVAARAEPAARSVQDNPYLPQSIKDRLSQSQARATRELRSLLDNERTGPIDRRSGSNWQKAQQRVKSRAAVILQQVIDDNLPRIEQELRQRLQAELEQAIRELGIDSDQPPPV